MRIEPESGRLLRQALRVGEVFPPRDEWDIAAYDTDDVVDGYREHRLTEPTPGNNRTAAYRWGWANAKRDITGELDGFEDLRRAYIRMTERPQ